MANVINHNISAFNTLRNLNKSNSSLSGSLQKLSSGFRINTGKDGPADLVISEQLRAQTVGLERAVRNTQEAQNVIGIAEGALNEMNEILKTMRGLALHAANNGITSPEQVAADQAEVDSAIQTIDRIANTTKYSDQFLLNGNKGLVYDRSTTIKGTQQNVLVNLGQSNIESIGKTEGYQIGISFAGTANAAAAAEGVGVADISKTAQKAYFEINPDAANQGDVNATSNSLTAAQSFILTGEKGARQFSFDVGATVGQVASAISNVADSTGVDASLIFSSGQTVNDTAAASNATAVIGGATLRAVDDQAIFNKTDLTKGITVSGALAGVVFGKNTDGQGRIHVKYTSATTAEFYKDASMSKESLVGKATSGAGIIAVNNSGLTSGNLTIVDGLNAGSAEYIAAGGITNNNGVTFSGNVDGGGNANNFFDERTLFSGVELGKNTDSEGKIYIKTVMGAGNTAEVFAYNDAAMRAEDLVAQTRAPVTMAANTTLILDEVRNDANSDGTGLGMALGIDTLWTAAAGSELLATVQFDNIGVRISSQDYGSDAFVKIQQQEGKIFQYYEQADSTNPTLVDAGTSGSTVQQNGQDATLSINGTQVKTDGLTLNVSTADLNGSFTFNEGSVGSTTIAQVGYSDGSVFSKATQLTDTGYTGGDNLQGSYLNNAGHTTTEFLNHFRGGMQFQLGEGAGDQERAVYSIQSMAVANLGMTNFSGQFDESKAIIEEKTMSLQDVLGGGLASLGTDPIKALEIIDNAINDVSNLRARLGATQKNLLQTNANSLNVAIENIMATESDIRDANMAKETTDFTKNQILVQAGTAMLAQANSLSQNVLSLLG